MSVGTCVESISRTAEHSIGMSSIHMTLLEDEEELVGPELDEAKLELVELDQHRALYRGKVRCSQSGHCRASRAKGQQR